MACRASLASALLAKLKRAWVITSSGVGRGVRYQLAMLADVRQVYDRAGAVRVSRHRSVRYGTLLFCFPGLPLLYPLCQLGLKLADASCVRPQVALADARVGAHVDHDAFSLAPDHNGHVIFEAED